MDIVRIETMKNVVYSALSVGLGFISDIDIESEKIRLLGHQRFALWSVKNLINLKKYRATVSYVKVDESKPFNEPLHPLSLANTSLNYADDSLCSDTEFSEFTTDFVRTRVDSWYSVNSHKSTYFSMGESLYQSLEGGYNFDPKDACVYGPSSTLPALTTALPLNQNWTTIEDDFVLIHILNITHISKDCWISPMSRIDDGLLHMIMIKGSITRSEFLTFLLGMSTGKLECLRVAAE